MILDYEQKYKEALEKARQLCAYPTSKPFISDLQDIFPELKEPDDERIRKCLLNYFNHVRYNGLDLKGTDVDEVIAWLEKQAPNVPKEEPQVYEIEGGKVITYSESEGYKVVDDYTNIDPHFGKKIKNPLK